jgi:uncharacterized membrane protein
MASLARHIEDLALPAALGAALMAGLLFAFSNFIMRALVQLPAAVGMEAMQRINVEILNPLFFVVFLGTSILCVAIIAASLRAGLSIGRDFLLLGAICYLAGVLGVTAVFNLPLNNVLASLAPSAAAEHWPQYVTNWLRWNHVRTVLAVLSSALLLIGIYAELAARRS